MLFSTLISDINDGIECILSKSVDDTELYSAADTPKGWDAIQGDLDMLSSGPR